MSTDCLRSVPSRFLVSIVVAGLTAGLAAAQQPPGGREAMWPAPTADDWKKPVLITFQRTWEDAVAVAKETGKPILVCVNMDGEIASEHYAGIRYRQPDIAELYAPYVCVIASVYRHTPADHDERGNRIPCPRFGSVTCGEHIAIEPVLYEKFMDGRRIAPRHIMVELDGSETYDVYYAFDTRSVFDRIRTGIAERQAPPVTVVRGDRSIVERVASRDVVDRVAVEQAYRQGDAAQRRQLLEAAIGAADAAPDELLRLAVFGVDAEMAGLARQALANARSESAVEVIAEALRVPVPAADREALLGALARLGDSSPKARTLAVVHRGLGTRSQDVDVDGWSAALAGGASYAPAAEWADLEAAVDRQTVAAVQQPADPAAKLELAEASLELALDPKTEQILAADPRTAEAYAKLMFEDARRAAREAEELGASGWRLDAVLAVTASRLGDHREAFRCAQAAAPEVPAGSTDRIAAEVLTLFAHGRQRAITRAVLRKESWPPEWLTDVDATYSILARHPLGSADHVADHYDFLAWLGANGKAAQVLTEGVKRYPEAWSLHDRLRALLLRTQGVAGMQSAYETLLAAPDASPTLPWFAGYTAIVAAEFHRRAGQADAARAAYDRAIAYYRQGIEARPDTADSADHYIALAMAGRARIAFEQGDQARAVDDLLAAFAAKPSAAATLDGLNISPVDTAKMVLAQLREQDAAALASRLEAALAALDPAMLELPAYERSPATGPAAGGRGR